MNRRQWITLSGAAAALRPPAAGAQEPAPQTPDKLLLKDYRPKSIYKIPVTEIEKAKYPVIDAHSHGARPAERLAEFVQVMDAVGVERTVVFVGANSGERMAEARKAYDKYPGRFELWCGFDLAGHDQPGFGPAAVKALEDCHRAGALGVGEVSDKGWGFAARRPGAPRQPGAARVPGPHADDPRMDALWDKCAQFGMPINIHVSDPVWGYGPMDNTNDGLMNGYTWRIDDTQPGIFGHDALIQTLDRAAEKHPKTTFIACHFANLDYDLARLGRMFDARPNLYADLSARFAEISPIPRFVNQFFRKYPDRILYGTDNGYSRRMFGVTFRLLETADEHFYARDLFNYHWPMHGLALPDAVLKKIYRDNAVRIFKRARA